MAIQQNHDPPPDESELAGFTVEGRAMLFGLEGALGGLDGLAKTAELPLPLREALRLALGDVRDWVIAVERELAKVKP